jgi:hypothetical protein
MGQSREEICQSISADVQSLDHDDCSDGTCDNVPTVSHELAGRVPGGRLVFAGLPRREECHRMFLWSGCNTSPWVSI